MTVFADNPYGYGEFSAGASSSATNIAKATGAGMAWIRMQIDWSTIETTNNSPNPPVYNWASSGTDAAIAAAYNAGLNIDFVIQGAPTWHTIAGPVGSGRTYTDPVAGSQFAKAVLDHYTSLYGTCPISAIECGNEQYSSSDQAHAAGNDPTIGIPFLRDTWNLVKPVYPNVLIGCFPSLTGGYRSDPANNYPATWYALLCNNGGTRYCNYVTHHHYSGQNDPITPQNGTIGFPGWWGAANSAMVAANAAYGYPIVPLRLTEFGWTAPTKVSEATQSLYYQEMLDNCRTSNGIVTHAYYFDIHGLYLNNGGVRPAYTMVQNYIIQYPQWLLTYYAPRALGGPVPFNYYLPDTATPYAVDTLARNPLAYYRLDEPAGTIAHDLTGHGYNATISPDTTLSQPGALFSETNASMYFTAAGSLTFPPSLNITTLTACSLDFWVAPTGYGWWYVVVTTTGSTTLTYLNGVLTSSTPTGGPIDISSILDFAGTPLAGGLDEVVVYGYVLTPADIRARFLLGAARGSGSLTDLLVFKEQIVKVYDSAGNFLDCWRDAPLLSGFKEAVNSATSAMKVQLPRSWSAFDLPGQPNSRGTVAQGNIVKYYLFGPGLPSTGLLRYQGIIDTYVPAIAESGQESVVVTIVPQSSAIADRGIGGSVIFGTSGDPSTYVDVVSQFNYWFTTVDPVTGTTYLHPLTLDPTNPASSGAATQYTYTNQQLKSNFDTMLRMLPSNWFYRPNPDLTTTLNVPPVTAQHTFVVGQHCSSPSYSEDWLGVKNVIYYQGGTPPGGGDPLTSIKVGASASTLGERIDLQSDSRVSDQNTLDVLAQGRLNLEDQPAVRATIRVVDYRGDALSGLGYDIETIKVGDSCVVLDATSPQGQGSTLWDVSEWDTDNWDYDSGSIVGQVVTIVGMTYLYDAVDLELSTFQPSQNASLLQVQQKFQDFSLV